VERGERKRPTACLRETLILEYVARTLSDAAVEDVDAHLQMCDDCSKLVRVLERDHHGTVDPQARPRAAGGHADTDVLFKAMRLDRGSLKGELLAGKYRLGELLGSGGMGVVYEAINTWTDRKVALKLLHPWLSADADTLDRFRREARIAGRISHPSIVEVLDLGQDPRDGSLYMVQKFLTGETLRKHIKERGALSGEAVAAIILPIVSALGAAHDGGVIHRDVKPENIILAVGGDGKIVPTLIDFGISKFTESNVPGGLLHTGRAVGTPLYMSPEQLRADGPLDNRTDVWSVGVLLFELLAGRRPFQANSNAEVAAAILHGEIPSLRAVMPSVPEALSQVVAKAMERDRERRFATMSAMGEALVAVLAPSSGPADRASALIRPQRSRFAVPVRVAVVLALLALVAAGIAAARARRQLDVRAAPRSPVVAQPSGVAAQPHADGQPTPGRQPLPPDKEAAPASKPPDRVDAVAGTAAPSTPFTATPSRPALHGTAQPSRKRAGPKPSPSSPAPASPAPAAPAPDKPPILDL
jgi:serine/threonine-protein kinase